MRLGYRGFGSLVFLFMGLGVLGGGVGIFWFMGLGYSSFGSLESFLCRLRFFHIWVQSVG